MNACAKSSVRAAIGPPASDETISSVLDRAANFWGIDRPSLLAAVGASSCGEDDDAPSPITLGAIAEMTGFPPASLAPLTVPDSAQQLQTGHRGGYCPRCWADDVAQQREPYFRRSWASCAALACDLHGNLLYAWEVDNGGLRRPPPVMRYPDEGIWLSDLAHAASAINACLLKPLLAFARHANAALNDAAAWPIEWRGTPETGRALIRLLTNNPAPYSEHLAMDRLVPEGPDARWFSGHRRASKGGVVDSPVTPLHQMADPAIRRTLWWLLARTVAKDWAPLPLCGNYSTCADSESWWCVFIGSAVSAHAECSYQGLGRALGFTSAGRARDELALC